MLEPVVHVLSRLARGSIECCRHLAGVIATEVTFLEGIAFKILRLSCVCGDAFSWEAPGIFLHPNSRAAKMKMPWFRLSARASAGDILYMLSFETRFFWFLRTRCRRSAGAVF